MSGLRFVPAVEAPDALPGHPGTFRKALLRGVAGALDPGCGPGAAVLLGHLLSPLGPVLQRWHIPTTPTPAGRVRFRAPAEPPTGPAGRLGPADP